MAISRIETFINTILKSKNVVADCAFEVEYLRSNYELTSARRALTNYRNAVKNTDLNQNRKDEILRCLVLSEAENAFLKNAKDLQINKDQSKLKPIYNVDKYINIATNLLNESSYILRVLGLCALTGRRAAEIGSSAKFEVVNGDPLCVLFDGQLKGRDRNDLTQYKIPVLADSALIVSCINSIRNDKPLFINNPEKFHNAASKELNLRCKKFFNFVTDGDLKVKDLRSIYGELSYMFHDDRSIAKTKFIAGVLGHGELDLNTVMSYLDFYIADQNYI